MGAFEAPAGRSVFYDLFPKAELDELVVRSKLLIGLPRRDCLAGFLGISSDFVDAVDVLGRS
jgi:hypothetical protein